MQVFLCFFPSYTISEAPGDDQFLINQPAALLIKTRSNRSEIQARFPASIGLDGESTT
jgi:hypothetical protein